MTSPPSPPGSSLTHAALPLPHLEHLADFVVELDPPLDLGETPQGHRRVVPIVGGHFEGPDLRGVVLPGGADWQTVRPDGSVDVSTAYTLRTESGDLVSIRTAGVRSGPPEVLEALTSGAVVDPSTYCFRVAVRFETGSTAVGWLNDVVGVAAAAREQLRVLHRTYAVR